MFRLVVEQWSSVCPSLELIPVRIALLSSKILVAHKSRYEKEKIFFRKARKLFHCQDLDSALVPSELQSSKLSLMVFTKRTAE